MRIRITYRDKSLHFKKVLEPMVIRSFGAEHLEIMCARYLAKKFDIKTSEHKGKFIKMVKPSIEQLQKHLVQGWEGVLDITFGPAQATKHQALVPSSLRCSDLEDRSISKYGCQGLLPPGVSDFQPDACSGSTSPSGLSVRSEAISDAEGAAAGAGAGEAVAGAGAGGDGAEDDAPVADHSKFGVVFVNLTEIDWLGQKSEVEKIMDDAYQEESAGGHSDPAI